MFNKWIQLLMITTCLLASSNAVASLISYKGYTLNEETNIVTGGGHEWLQWDLTTGLSVEEALAVHSQNGWRLANNSEVAALFNTFTFGATFLWDANEDTNQRVINNDGFFEDMASDPEKQFVLLFGNTFLDYVGNIGSSDPLEFSSALFSDNFDGTRLINRASVYDDNLFSTAQTHSNGVSFMSERIYSAQHFSANTGIALIRASSPINPVPEPASFILLTAGIFGLLVARRHGQPKY